MFREAFLSRVLPALDNFAPDLIIISAGFDAHHRDPLAEINLTEDDFDWATGQLMRARRAPQRQPARQPARRRLRSAGTGIFGRRPCRATDEGIERWLSETNEDVKAMSFEQALDALEKIVDDLERGDVPLDQSIRIYERGEALKAHCDRLLKAAEDKVEKIRLSRDGKPVGTRAARRGRRRLNTAAAGPDRSGRTVMEVRPNVPKHQDRCSISIRRRPMTKSATPRFSSCAR